MAFELSLGGSRLQDLERVRPTSPTATWASSWGNTRQRKSEVCLGSSGVEFAGQLGAIDLSIESREGGEELIPDELLDRLAANLFGSPASSEHPSHPAEDLRAALFEEAGRVEIDLPGGGTLRLGPARRRQR